MSQSYSNESCLSECTYTYEINADNQVHNFIYGAYFYKYTCKITAEKNN